MSWLCFELINFNFDSLGIVGNWSLLLFSFFFFSFSWSWSQFSIYRYTRSIDKFYCTKKVYESRLAWVDERVTRFAWRLFESILIRNVRIRNELIWKNSKDHICNVYFTWIRTSLSNRLTNWYTRAIGNWVCFFWNKRTRG